jgi:hypothetical protein
MYKNFFVRDVAGHVHPIRLSTDTRGVAQDGGNAGFMRRRPGARDQGALGVLGRAVGGAALGSGFGGGGGKSQDPINSERDNRGPEGGGDQDLPDQLDPEMAVVCIHEILKRVGSNADEVLEMVQQQRSSGGAGGGDASVPPPVPGQTDHPPPFRGQPRVGGTGAAQDSPLAARRQMTAQNNFFSRYPQLKNIRLAGR